MKYKKIIFLLLICSLIKGYKVVMCFVSDSNCLYKYKNMHGKICDIFMPVHFTLKRPFLPDSRAHIQTRWWELASLYSSFLGNTAVGYMRASVCLLEGLTTSDICSLYYQPLKDCGFELEDSKMLYKQSHIYYQTLLKLMANCLYYV